MYKKRRVTVFSLIIALVFWGIYAYNESQPQPADIGQVETVSSEKDLNAEEALMVLSNIPIKGRAPKTGYARNQFGNGWATKEGCDTRNTILARDLKDVKVDENCKVISGVLNDPYTGQVIVFERGSTTSSAVQIDHVVALSNAWQTGAQQLSEGVRVQFANDPLNLLAVDGPANQAKGDGDAATWLPKYKAFRCQYVIRQIQIKHKYDLWVTQPEGDAMKKILNTCN